MKDELGGEIISEFCCLKAKTYTSNLDNDAEFKKGKGTKKCVVKRHITFDNCLDTLFKTTKILKSQYTFKSDHHTIYTQKLNKIALNFFDDKRIQCNDKITTYPYGYFDNTSNIIDETKDNTKELNKIDNSSIIPKNYNTKDRLKKNIINNTKDLLKKNIINNTGIYADNAKSTCIDSIKCTYAYVGSKRSTCVDIIKSTNAYIDSIKSTSIENVNITYEDSAKSTHAYLDRIKSA